MCATTSSTELPFGIPTLVLVGLLLPISARSCRKRRCRWLGRRSIGWRPPGQTGLSQRRTTRSTLSTGDLIPDGTLKHSKFHMENLMEQVLLRTRIFNYAFNYTYVYYYVLRISVYLLRTHTIRITRRDICYERSKLCFEICTYILLKHVI